MSNNLWATNFSGDFIAGANDHASYYTNSQLLGGLDGCGQPAVIVEATQIPDWLLLAAGAVVVLFLLKRR